MSNTNTSFKEFLRLSEAGMIQPGVNPAVTGANNAIRTNFSNIVQTKPGIDAGAALNQAIAKPLTTGTVQPAAMAQALKPSMPGQQPGQQTQMMMKKKMAKGMRKR